MRDPLAALFGFLAAASLGLSAGAMLTEAVVFVDFWRAMPPAEFLAWFKANEPGLVAFFAPLQSGSAVCVLAAAIFSRGASRWLHVTALLLAVAALVLYPLYFQEVNASFVAASIAVERVPEELARWASWQWLRTAIGAGAFAFALVGQHRR